MVAALWWIGVAWADVVAVGHDGEVVGDAIEWTSTVVADPPIAALDLVVPLPADAELFTTGTPIVRDERVVGVQFDAPVRHALLRVREPLHTGDVALSVPIVDTEAVQRVTLAGADFVPAASIGIAHRMGDRKQLGIGPNVERAADRALDGERRRLDERPIYFVADRRVREAGGLAGTLWPEHARDAGVKRGLGAVAIFVSGLFVAGLVWARRRLDLRAIVAEEVGGSILELVIVLLSGAIGIATLFVPGPGALQASVPRRAAFVAPQSPAPVTVVVPAPTVAIVTLDAPVAPKPRPAAVDLVGAWEGVVAGAPSTIVVQRAHAGRLSGVYFVDDAEGRREEPLVGSVDGTSIALSGPGIVLRMKADGWHLSGRCRVPETVDAVPCTFDRRDQTKVVTPPE
jgi:hypothetical protein